MALAVAVGTVSAAVGSVSVTGLSFQPKAVILAVTNRTSAGWSSSLSQFGMGFLASGSSRALAHTSRNGGTSTGNIDEEVKMTSGALTMLNTFGSVHLEATLTSLNSDGFTINCSTASSAWLIEYIALGGSDLTDVAVGDFLTGTSTGNVDVTGLGFEPDAVIIAHVNVGSALPFTSRTGTRFGFGVGVSSSERWASVRNVRDQVLPTEAAAQQRDDAVLLGLTTGNAQDMVGDYSGSISGGFRVNLSDAPASDVRVAYLALKGPGVKAGLDTTVTSAGAKDTATTGITPKALILAGVLKTAGSTIDTATDAMTLLGLSDFTNEASVTTRTADAANPADVSSELTTNRVFMLSAIGGATEYEADASAAADEFTLTYSSAAATARQFGYLALSDTPTPPPAGGRNWRTLMGVGV